MRSSQSTFVAILITLCACENVTEVLVESPAADLAVKGVPTRLPLAYVANNGVGAVQVISPSTSSVIATVPVSLPNQVAIGPDGAFVYATSASPSAIKVIETSSNAIVATIPFGPFTPPKGVSVTPDGKFVYVPLFGRVEVISTATNTVVSRAFVGVDPQRVAFTPDGALAYVTNFGATFVPGSVSVIQTATNTEVARIPTSNGPWAIAITPDGALVYVSHVTPGPTPLTVIETSSNTVVATIPGVGGRQMAVTPDGAFLYASASVQGVRGVGVVETASNTLVTLVPLPGTLGVTLTSDGAFAYVAKTVLGEVSVIETTTNTVVSTVNVGTGSRCCTGPIGIAITPLLSVTPIDIDIKPGSDPNSINCTNENGVIPVAILTTPDFDATTVDHTTVTFERATETHIDKKTGLPRRHEEDVDGDGDTDLVFHFRYGDTSLDCSSTEGTLTGETFDGIPIEGTDAVNMIDPGQP